MGNDETWLITAMVMMVAGVIKGIAGLGLPTIAVCLLVIFFDAHKALGLIVLPLLFSNLLQALNSGQFRWVVNNFWPFLLSISLTILLASQLASQVNERVIYLCIAMSVIFFLLSQKKVPRLRLDNRHYPFYAALAGGLAGLFGGLTTVWGPPTVVFLRLLGLEKEQFVRAAGWIFLFGALPLTVGYWFSGILTTALLPVGFVGSLFAMLGMIVGKLFRPRISEERFVFIIDVILALMAVNLIRKALGY